MTEIHVAVAVLRDSAGRVLLSRRRGEVHLSGYWEFPGGKVEAGESLGEALARELDEELGVSPVACELLIQVPFTYPEKRVVLDVWTVSALTGEPHGREGQELAWVAVDQLHHWQLPPADIPIVAALRLPDRYIITPDPADYERADFLQRLEDVLATGGKLVQLRSKRLAPKLFDELAQGAVAVASRYDAALLVNGPAEAMDQPGVGVHLTAARLMACHRRPVARDRWLGVSCHSAEELERAAAVGADFAVLSPVCPTSTHPDAAPLGWEQFARWVGRAALPVFGLGGLTAEDVGKVRRCGGQGVAGIRAFWPG